jgi:hypothetical protein
MTLKPARSVSKILTIVALGLAAVTLTAGCSPVIFRLDETRTTGACPWTEANSAIVCVGFSTDRESLPFEFRHPLPRSSDHRRSADERSI